MGGKKHTFGGLCCMARMAILIHVSTIISDPDGRILFVREAKEVHRGLWNLPGGHVEEREELRTAAIREVKEETSLEVTLQERMRVLEGISPALHSIRFTFAAEHWRGTPQAGDEILEVRWMLPKELLAMKSEELVGAPYLRAIIDDWVEGSPSGLLVVKRS